MKILMVLMGLDIGGAETHVVELSKALALRGHDITVVSSGGIFVDELLRAGMRHVKLPLGSRRLVKLLKSYIGLRRLLKAEHFDLVHAHARIPAFLCGILHRRMKFPFITTAHWVFKTGPILNLMTDWGERTIAVSEDIRTYLMDNYGVLHNHITVTINGVDTQKFSPDTPPGSVVAEFDMQPSAHRVVYVSRMDTDRSAVAHNLIAITPAFCNKYADFELVIVGGGNDFAAVKAEAEACNKKVGRRAVIMTGPRADINLFVAACDVFVGVSRAALEAMAAAKPVIIAGNEGNIGLFSEDKLPLGIATNFCCRGCAIPTDESLMTDIDVVFSIPQEAREALGTYNRSVIERLFSGSRMADDCESAYTDLLSIDRRRPYDILISGYYGYKNTGDDSLLQAIIQNLSEIKPMVDITVLSKTPAETARLYGVRSIHRFNVFRVLSAMRRAKLLISGGGSLVQDVTSTKSLYYYLMIISAAKKLGMRVMVYASGIGPINVRRNRAYAARVLDHADLITLREHASKDELKAMGVTKPPVCVTADPAFSLKQADEAAVSRICAREGLPGKQGYFIVSVRPWERAGVDLHSVLAQLCDDISEKYGLTPVFVPMQRSWDTEVNRRIAGLMKRHSVLLRGAYTGSELMGVIAGARLVVGMRLHTLIYAMAACVPVFGLSYDPKIDSVMGYLNQQAMANVERPDLDGMKASVDGIMQNYDVIRETLSREAQTMRLLTKRDAGYAIGLTAGETP